MAEVERTYNVTQRGVGRPDYTAAVLGPYSRESRVESRSTVRNDNGVVAPTAPPLQIDGLTWYNGKFFSRGVRGKIEEIQVYCMRTGAGEIDIRYSPYPGTGPIGQVTITPGANWGWAAVAIDEAWKYDSIFIWIYAVDADVSWGYDEAERLDGHQSTDGGATWSSLDRRFYIRVLHTAETTGDVPVSGTVNVIEIPSVAGEFAGGSATLATNVQGSICSARGSGTMIEAYLQFHTAVVPTKGAIPPAVEYHAYIYADGSLAGTCSNRDLTQSETSRLGQSEKGEFFQTYTVDPLDGDSKIKMRVPIKFQRSLSLQARHTTGAPVLIGGILWANQIK